jgi:hypothetical protein
LIGDLGFLPEDNPIENRGYTYQEYECNVGWRTYSLHRGNAVSLLERYAKGGDNAKLKDWAGKTLPALLFDEKAKSGADETAHSPQ